VVAKVSVVDRRSVGVGPLEPNPSLSSQSVIRSTAVDCRYLPPDPQLLSQPESITAFVSVKLFLLLTVCLNSLHGYMKVEPSSEQKRRPLGREPDTVTHYTVT